MQFKNKTRFLDVIVVIASSKVNNNQTIVNGTLLILRLSGIHPRCLLRKYKDALKGDRRAINIKTNNLS